MITLGQLLESRDRRAERQRQLLEAFPGFSLVCLTVQLPGSEKRNDRSLLIAEAGVAAIRDSFSPDYEELKDLETGFEGYFPVQLEALEAKRKACEIEDTHPLGRLMDIDVLSGMNGHLAVPVGRTNIGLAARKCLLCENDARYCMRAHSHSLPELLAEIDRIVEIYLKM